MLEVDRTSAERGVFLKPVAVLSRGPAVLWTKLEDMSGGSVHHYIVTYEYIRLAETIIKSCALKAPQTLLLQ